MLRFRLFEQRHDGEGLGSLDRDGMVGDARIP